MYDMMIERRLVRPGMFPFVEIALKWAVKYYKRMDLSIAFVVAMCEPISLYYKNKLLTKVSNSPAPEGTNEVDQSKLGPGSHRQRRESHSDYGKNSLCQLTLYIDFSDANK